MNYLLDTHALLWLLIAPNKLSTQVKIVTSQPSTTLFVSVISFWEASIKNALGKLTLTGIIPETLPQYAANSGVEIIGLDPQDAASFHQLKKRGHKDPFDRILVWQAIRQGYTLISKDKELLFNYHDQGLKVLW